MLKILKQVHLRGNRLNSNLNQQICFFNLIFCNFRPCILIFDSLAGASRSRVVATLRDYLSCEYKAKLGVDKVFNKDVIKGACPKVPQQTNFTDCGLYLLQYVESFFTVRTNMLLFILIF